MTDTTPADEDLGKLHPEEFAAVTPPFTQVHPAGRILLRATGKSALRGIGAIAKQSARAFPTMMRSCPPSRLRI
ncbi:hypothetical protein A6P54_22065 [Bacillus sp. MKU004]|uniref:hypothetical protein n=1 Tax=Sphingobium sp. RSMS TaxID=520734 RepID=UPI0007E3737C|nr:hypothetical protein [Sphingobium sp. RSMS]OAT80712.1 hypothetical protein A6P54_22065 [Bacillus sp. MKU004]UXC93914.1 hypothetical protein EGM87_24380 [Sphingobium sp. RSMS]